jgi:pimeloyl-ACP methyl ester carboxylesterase
MLMLLGYRAWRRRQVARALTITSPRGIVDEGFARIGGIEQWISIRGEDRDNPILVVVHGGPGSPYSIFTPRVRAWERHFTIVQWDQRGAGKTFRRNRATAVDDTLTFDRLARDGLELVEHICARLGHAKVILLGSSAGTIVSTAMVKQRPERFHAYVATDLNVDTQRAEAMGYALTLERLRAAGRRRAVAALAAIGPDPSRWGFAAWQRKQRWLMRVDPVASRLPTRLLLPSALTSPAHSLRDVADLAAGLAWSQERLFAELMRHDARRLGMRFELPLFLFQGDRDVFTPAALAQAYFDEIDAPLKQAVLVTGAGHFAAFVQPAQVLAELLARIRPLL